MGNSGAKMLEAVCWEQVAMLFQTDPKPTNTCGCPAVNNVDVGGTRLRVENA